MKKVLLFMVLTIILVVLISSMALAAEPEVRLSPEVTGNAVKLSTEESAGVTDMNDGFYTWAMLGTYAGCLAATLAVTQFIKPVWPKKLAVEFLSYVIALIILLLANVFIGGLTFEKAGISAINAVIVALAANGGYNGIKKISKAASRS